MRHMRVIVILLTGFIKNLSELTSAWRMLKLLLILSLLKEATVVMNLTSVRWIEPGSDVSNQGRSRSATPTIDVYLCPIFSDYGSFLIHGVRGDENVLLPRNSYSRILTRVFRFSELQKGGDIRCCADADNEVGRR